MKVFRMRGLRCWMACAGLMLAGWTARGDVSITSAGPELSICVPAVHAGSRVLFMWGAADHGTDTNAWANVREVAAAVPAGGARYALDLAELGVTAGETCRVILYEQLDWLDKLGTFSPTAYVDTGVKDTDCHGVAFGFHATEKTEDWGYFIGSDETKGFIVGNNNTDFTSWNWAHRDGKKYPRPAVYTDQINEAVFGSGKFTLNGTDVSTALAAGSVGTSGKEIRVGNWAEDSRRQYGWWSHVSFTDADGEKIIDYVPVRFRSSGRVVFFDRVSGEYVASTGGGDFMAGDVTNTTEVVGANVAFTPRDFEPITISAADAKLTVRVPAYLAGDQLVLVWDDTDRGDRPEDWANSAVLVAALPAGEASISVDPARLGVPSGKVVGVFALHRFKMLDRVKVANDSHVDTGVVDSTAHRAVFGFYAEASDYSNTDWGIFMGTRDGAETDMTGFVLSLEYGNPEKWYWKACGYRSGPRPVVSKTAINEVDISQAGFAVNGSILKAGLNAATLGATGGNIYIGRGSMDSRHQAGWWSHLKLEGVDGGNLIDYVPVQRVGDGKVGFYDRVGNRFVGPSGSGAMAAGTVTNESAAIVHRRSGSLRLRLPPPPFEITVEGAQLTVKASPALALEGLRLVWDGHTHELADVVPAAGGTYRVDLSTLEGGVSESEYTVQSIQRMDLLERIKMPDRTTYIDTGVKDTDCCGVFFGFLGTERSETGGFENFIGSVEDNGFTVGANNQDETSWYWAFYDGKKWPRPKVSTTDISEATFARGVFTLNGVPVNSELYRGAIGASGRNLFVGTWASKSRYWHGWWSYVRFDDAGGNALIDYVPARRCADGKVGFFDRAAGAFVFSSGAGAFEAGATTNEDVRVVHQARSFTLANLIATAVWTGGGDVTYYEDPANWVCANAAGETVAGYPGPEAMVSLPSELAGDCNLLGLSSARIALTGTIDLKGHTLVLPVDADFPDEAVVTDSVGGGELRFSVAKGVTATNSKIAASGRTKVVKVGPGTLVVKKPGQSYTGGLFVTEGVFACGGRGSAGVYGDPANTITIASGATFDCNGHDGHAAAKLVLAGGTVANTVAVPGDVGLDWFADVTLEADSFVRADRWMLFSAAGESPAALKMNDHTLTLDIDGNCSFGLVNVMVTGGGTINQRTGGFLQLGATGCAGVTAETTTLNVGRSLRVLVDSVVRNYTSSYGGSWDQGTNCVCVTGRFLPKGSRWHSTRLLNGATLDLSAQTGVWTASTTANYYDEEAHLTFAENAAIVVDMGDRVVSEGDQIVSWTREQYRRSATFTWSLDLPLTATPRGLFARKSYSSAIIIR